MRLAITGIRDLDPSDAPIVEMAVSEAIGAGASELIFGGARGSDTVALLAACAAIDERTNLVVVVPGTLQEQPAEAIDAIQACAKEIVELRLPIHRKDSFLKRNVAMLERADGVLAFWDGQPGGTQFTIDAAKKRGLPVQIVPVGRGQERAGSSLGKIDRFPIVVDGSCVGINAEILVVDRYVSLRDGGNPLTYLVHAIKKGTAAEPELGRLGKRVARLILRHFKNIDMVIPIPRRTPNVPNDLGPLVEVIAADLGVEDGTNAVIRRRLPTGGVVKGRRERFGCEEHAKSMAIKFRELIGSPRVVILENVMFTGGTVCGAARLLKRATSCSVVGVVVLLGAGDFLADC
jgi:predicted amidophosphoribosyltransferase